MVSLRTLGVGNRLTPRSAVAHARSWPCETPLWT